jgi:general secretion pathway protein I
LAAIQSAAGSRDPGGVNPKPPTVNAVAVFWVEVAVRAGDGTAARLAGLKLEPVAKP